MTIRLAIDDSETEEKTDALYLKDRIKHGCGPYPPKESVESIGWRLANPDFLCMIDDEHNTVAGFHIVTEGNPDAPVKEAQEPHVIVIWWLPRADWAEDNMPLLIPVFAAACEEVLRRYPDSESWAIYGDYPGIGKTEQEREQSSLEIVSEWATFWNQNPAIGDVVRLGVNPYNRTQYRPIGTIEKIIEFANWLESERR